MEIDVPLLAAVGVLVVVATVVDVVWTTIAVRARRGPISDVVAHAVVAVGWSGRPSHARRATVGMLAAAAVPAMWVLLLWGGFALMFLSDDDAVVVAASQAPVGALGRVAYAAGGLAGAGAGLTAGTETWQLVNNLAAIAGLGLVTLALSYVLQVVSAVVSERSSLSQVAALGRPGAVAGRAGDLVASHALTVLLLTVADGVSTAAQRHLAFPTLQYFHSTSAATSPPINLARYALVLDRLEEVDPHAWETPIRAGRAAVDSFLDTLRLPGATEDRASRLDTYLREEGWAWDDVHHP